MPGMAASPKIFERIKLDESIFDCHYLEWIEPNSNEPLQSYAERISKNITHKNPVLVGVSFGGILVQEMKAFVNPQKVIIVSSVKSNTELPLRMKIVKSTKAYKLFPTSLAQNVDRLTKLGFTKLLKQRIELYKMYLTMNSKNYLDWAIQQVVSWERKEVDPEIIHIHGDADEVFPSKNIHNYIKIKGGTHIMLINRHKWFNSNLPEIILKKEIQND